MGNGARRRGVRAQRGRERAARAVLRARGSPGRRGSAQCPRPGAGVRGMPSDEARRAAAGLGRRVPRAAARWDRAGGEGAGGLAPERKQRRGGARRAVRRAARRAAAAAGGAERQFWRQPMRGGARARGSAAANNGRGAAASAEAAKNGAHPPPPRRGGAGGAQAGRLAAGRGHGAGTGRAGRPQGNGIGSAAGATAAQLETQGVRAAAGRGAQRVRRAGQGWWNGDFPPHTVGQEAAPARGVRRWVVPTGRMRGREWNGRRGSSLGAAAGAAQKWDLNGKRRGRGAGARRGRGPQVRKHGGGGAPRVGPLVARNRRGARMGGAPKWGAAKARVSTRGIAGGRGAKEGDMDGGARGARAAGPLRGAGQGATGGSRPECNEWG
jgi:hypothetical protein